MSVEIRTARLEDLTGIVAMERESASAAHWSEAQYRQRFDDGVILVADQAGSLRGFVCARGVAGEWEIENVVVCSAQRQRGIANGLLSELVRRARSEAVSLIVLEVRESNLAAHRLYEKNGFQAEGRRKSYYRDPVEDAILYGLRFDE
jgi:ribosomal-protein-alanine N-acetyltransferase